MLEKVSRSMFDFCFVESRRSRRRRTIEQRRIEQRFGTGKHFLSQIDDLCIRQLIALSLRLFARRRRRRRRELTAIVRSMCCGFVKGVSEIISLSSLSNLEPF
jgi:hypothetical protein